MEDAQKEKIIQFSFDSTVQLNQIEQDFCRQFNLCQLSHIQDSVFQVRSDITLDLMPFMSFFDNRGIKVMEAKIIKPSLEEVFVKITGIEREIMKKEKEGKKK